MKRMQYAVECSSPSPKGGGTAERKSRKFSDPLYLTAQGYLAGFPESGDQLFDTMEQAQAAIKTFGKPEHASAWLITTTTLEQHLKNKRYLRWLKEVKPLAGGYKEPQRSLEEAAAIYQDGGLDALKKIYSRAHAFKLEKRIVQAGLSRD
jgi:hypothetical protein